VVSLAPASGFSAPRLHPTSGIPQRAYGAPPHQTLGVRGIGAGTWAQGKDSGPYVPPVRATLSWGGSPGTLREKWARSQMLPSSLTGVYQGLLLLFLLGADTLIVNRLRLQRAAA